MKRTGRLRPVSAKRAEQNELRRDAIMVVRTRCRGWCEACPMIVAAGYAPPSRGPNHQGVDGHEPLMRSSGGSITDPDNIVWACRPAHDWIHAHPLEAQAAGLIRRG